jgi:hypothetical protein
MLLFVSIAEYLLMLSGANHLQNQNEQIAIVIQNKLKPFLF